MAKRSLKASEVGIKKAKQAFNRTGWTQEYPASAVGLETRQSIWKFFSGRPIDWHLFIDICFQLNLEWEEIVAPPEPEEDEVEALSVDHPASAGQWQELRSRVGQLIQSQCAMLQVSLDTAHPLVVEQNGAIFAKGWVGGTDGIANIRSGRIVPMFVGKRSF